MTTAIRRSDRCGRVCLLGTVILLGLRLTGLAETRYVSLTGGDVAPYTSWMTAATSIQAAVDASVAGDFIWVTDGVYRAGARVTPGGTLSNRVVITNDLTLQSVNGRKFTAIEGAGPLGSNAVRCVFMTEGRLEGFTLTNGFTGISGDIMLSQSGGGIYAGAGRLVGCLVIGNAANFYGGGVCGGVLTDCEIIANAAPNGGGVISGSLSRCSVIGNAATTGMGGGVYMSALTNCHLQGNAALSGGGARDSVLCRCVITDNLARETGTGGGVQGGSLSNCIVSGNAAYDGGGVYQSLLQASAVVGNWASNRGGGVAYSTAYNCTVTCNKAADGGGVNSGYYLDCIIHFNRAPIGPNWSFVSPLTMSNCFLWPPGFPALNCRYEDPRLLTFSRIASDSPCVGAGVAPVTGGFDLDGEAWRNPPSVGCDEPYAFAATGLLAVAIRVEVTQAVAGASVRLVGLTEGVPVSNAWQFGDGESATNTAFPLHAWGSMGSHEVVFTAFNITHPEGVAATSRVTILSAEDTATHTATNSPFPGAPFNAWSNAAHSIQEAVDAQGHFGGWVCVHDGIYAVGGRSTPGAGLTNRVVVTNNIVLKSMGGPAVTVIQGSRDEAAPVRCVFLGAGRLEGFTLLNGGTYALGGGRPDLDRSGGGVYAGDVLVSNCFFTGNLARGGDGGGAAFGTYKNCVFSGNVAFAYSGGVDWGTLYSCQLISNDCQTSPGWGGGIGGGCAFNCTFIGNTAKGVGDGAYGSALHNCLLIGHRSNATYVTHLYNCTVAGNARGARSGTYYNSVIFGNGSNVVSERVRTAPRGPNLLESGTSPTLRSFLTRRRATTGSSTSRPVSMPAPTGRGRRAQPISTATRAWSAGRWTSGRMSSRRTAMATGCPTRGSNISPAG